jgi:hypothetical protein
MIVQVLVTLRTVPPIDAICVGDTPLIETGSPKNMI